VIDDTARAEMRELMGRYPDPRSALLPMLHLVQAYEGYVTPEGIEACAQELGLAEAEVAGVATFYTMYKRHPMGEYHVGVCTNTLCAVMGGDAIWDRVSSHLGVGHDEVTDDGRVSLERVECNAACDYAPVVMVNWEFFDHQSPQSAVALVDALRAGEPVTSTRGACLCTFREAQRVIAGFADDRAGEGVAAGDTTLRGLLLARENGWEAPPMPQAPALQQAEPAPVREVAHEEARRSAQESGGPEQPPHPPHQATPPAPSAPAPKEDA
jgi:NADH-quinone oxidoreductase subunit E